MWTSEEIKKLRQYANEYFGVEIPLSAQIEEIRFFLDQSRIKFNEKPKLIKAVRYTLKWFPNYWNQMMEIEMPDEAIGYVREAFERELELKCAKLADMSKYFERDEAVIKAEE